MLSPAMKDPTPSDRPETPVTHSGRSVLRDVNTTRSPVSKNELSAVSGKIPTNIFFFLIV